TVEAQLGYDPYGKVTQLQGSMSPDLQYADYYQHSASGLNLTRTRAYSPSVGRFINRDFIGEAGGLNLYGYVQNDPVSDSDPSGLRGLLPYTRKQICTPRHLAGSTVKVPVCLG